MRLNEKNGDECTRTIREKWGYIFLGGKHLLLNQEEIPGELRKQSRKL